MNDVIQFFSSRFNEQNQDDKLSQIRKKAFHDFTHAGIPPVRHEEWKYTRISSLFRGDFIIPGLNTGITAADIAPHRLPRTERTSELVFVNGIYQESFSMIRHMADELTVLPLGEAAAGAFADIVEAHLGHSADYHPDGINALNTAFINQGIFIASKKAKLLEDPVYIYHITDSRAGFMFCQPRILVYAAEGSSLSIAEHYASLGGHESFTNEVIEIVAAAGAVTNYYKLQNEGPLANHAGTTHCRQIGKCLTNAVTITLSGALVRNNLNMIMESEGGESHMYGLYLLDGKTHADNHTIVDNVKPHCFSNELYKGIMDGQSTGVFNGKIFVRKDAQKTNAYQSNKNILLSETASANTKPQLEIFADDVKCSHGCTIGRLDEEALFYLRSRGISEKNAKSLLLHAFAVDILDNIKPAPLREYADRLISERLDFNF
jgi:Fe-S cluster assembly protein SufD